MTRFFVRSIDPVDLAHLIEVSKAFDRGEVFPCDGKWMTAAMVVAHLRGIELPGVQPLDVTETVTSADLIKWRSPSPTA